MALDPKTRSALLAANWPEIIEKLTVHATFAVKKHFLKREIDSLPDGQQVKDFVQDAIDRVFSGERKWDPSKVPDLLHYMKWVFNSEVNHYFKSASSERREYVRSEDPDDDPLDQMADATSSTMTDLDEEELKTYLRAKARGNEIAELIAYCLEEGFSKPVAIAETIRSTPEAVSAGLRKIRKWTEEYLKTQQDDSEEY